MIDPVTSGVRVDETMRIRRSSLGDEIADRLRKQIMTGVILPGNRIYARDLQRDFGVSHIPIREALRSLEAEGLVHSTPSRGIVAANVGLEELAEIWDLRRIVEGQVARRAAAALDGEYLAKLDIALIDLQRSLHNTQSADYLRAHQALHWSVLAAGATGWIRRVLEQLWQGSERYIYLFSNAIEFDRYAFMAQHEVLVTVCHKRDPGAVEQALIEHINLTEDDVRRGYLASREGAI